jgi:hypothetical protein
MPPSDQSQAPASSSVALVLSELGEITGQAWGTLGVVAKSMENEPEVRTSFSVKVQPNCGT